MSEHIALIPARQGSKRLKNKNIKPLAGKPLIAWTIEAALASKCFSEVLVSTDCEEIADVARAYGANVPFMRPRELAGDEASTDDVVRHLQQSPVFQQRNISTLTILQPTSPLRGADDIKEAFELFQQSPAIDGVVSVCPCDFPVQFCNSLPPDGNLAGFINIENLQRTQELSVYYRLNGAIYILGQQAIGNSRLLYAVGSSARAYVMSAERSVDIDEQLDFEWAEFLLSRQATD